MNLKNLLWLIACFFFVVPFLHAGVVSLTDAEILRLQALVQASPEGLAWKKIILYQADLALKHDPDPVSQIQIEGKLEGNVEKNESMEAVKDMPRIQYLALAYALTGEAGYLNKASVYLTAWANTCQPPQASGSIDGAINATFLEPLLYGYDLIRPKMNDADRNTLDDWIRSIAQTLLSTDNPTNPMHRNNHEAHRLKTIVQIAFILNDKGLEQQVLESLKNYMGGNLNQDGTTLDFIERDALHYHVYDLSPLALAAILYQRGLNIDLYNYKTDKGASVSQCVAFVLPYARGEKNHSEFVNTSVSFDVQRGANGEKAYGAGAQWNRKESIPCLECSQYFQPELNAILGSLESKPGSVYPTLQCLLNEAMRSGPLPTVSNAIAPAPMAAVPAAAGANPAPQETSVLMDDFENGTGVNRFGSAWRATMDNHQLGTTLNPNPFQPSPGGAPVSPKFAAHIWGHFGKHIAPWPFALLQGGFNPENAATDLSAFSAVRFYVKGDKKNYLLQLVQPSVKDFAYYLTAFQATTEWTQVTLPFASFQQPPWGAKVPLQWKNVRLFQFSPDTAVFSDEDYDLWIDDIELVK